MATRAPVAADFPSTVTLHIVPPPAAQPPTNILVLLHGLGGDAEPFARLARQMALPETLCLALQAPAPLPFGLGGFHWGDDIVFDQATGVMDPDVGCARASAMLSETIIKSILVDKCGYRLRNILCFGFGQGATVALTAVATPDVELAGVVSIGGPLPAGVVQQPRAVKHKTPIVALGGSSRSLLTTSAIRNIKNVFESVQTTTWQRPGDGMPTNRDEMLPIMTFFARRLRSRAGVPDGAVELS